MLFGRSGIRTAFRDIRTAAAREALWQWWSARHGHSDGHSTTGTPRGNPVLMQALRESQKAKDNWGSCGAVSAVHP